MIVIKRIPNARIVSRFILLFSYVFAVLLVECIVNLALLIQVVREPVLADTAKLFYTAGTVPNAVSLTTVVSRLEIVLIAIIEFDDLMGRGRRGVYIITVREYF